MNFSAVSDQDLLGKVARLPLKFIPAGTAVPILQGKLKGKRWIVGSSNHGCWLGSYEYEKRLAFEKTVRKGAVVFDIGAHVGFYTLLASALVGPTGKVFAFEPQRQNLHYLKEHLHLNAIQNVRVIDAAVSDCDGMSWWEEGQNNSTGHLASRGSRQVRTMSLDGTISAGELPTPAYIKIDVEGGEMLVLSGAKSTLQGAHPILFLATHGRRVHDRCCLFLRSLGYRLQAIGADSVGEAHEVLALQARLEWELVG